MCPAELHLVQERGKLAAFPVEFPNSQGIKITTSFLKLPNTSFPYRHQAVRELPSVRMRRGGPLQQAASPHTQVLDEQVTSLLQPAASHLPPEPGPLLATHPAVLPMMCSAGDIRLPAGS